MGVNDAPICTARRPDFRQAALVIRSTASAGIRPREQSRKCQMSSSKNWTEACPPSGRLELLNDCFGCGEIAAGALFVVRPSLQQSHEQARTNNGGRFSRYLHGRVLADSVALHWSGVYVRRFLCPRVVDWFLVPATPEPLISCGLAGSAEFREREVGQAWVTRQIGPGHIYPLEDALRVCFSSPVGRSSEIVQVHIAVDHYLAALEAAYPGRLKRWKSSTSDLMKHSRIFALPAPRCSPHERRENPDASRTWRSFSLPILSRNTSPPRRRRIPRRPADLAAAEGGGPRERAPCREISVETLAELGTSPFPLFPRVQADGDVTPAVCHAPADHARPTTHT